MTPMLGCLPNSQSISVCACQIVVWRRGEEGGIVTLLPGCKGLKAAKNAVFSGCEATESMVNNGKEYAKFLGCQRAKRVRSGSPFCRCLVNVISDLEGGPDCRLGI